MNVEMKDALNGHMFVDYEDMNGIMFNVIELNDGRFNLLLEIFNVEEDDEEGENTYGVTIRTAIYEDNLVDMATKVKVILDLGLFDHLFFVDEASCLDIEAEEKYKFDWSDYFASHPMTIN
jgi:hypothetical protein